MIKRIQVVISGKIKKPTLLFYLDFQTGVKNCRQTDTYEIQSEIIISCCSCACARARARARLRVCVVVFLNLI